MWTESVGRWRPQTRLRPRGTYADVRPGGIVEAHVLELDVSFDGVRLEAVVGVAVDGRFLLRHGGILDLSRELGLKCGHNGTKVPIVITGSRTQWEEDAADDCTD